MNAGTLDRRIELQKPLETQDSFGGYSRTTETVATVWAAVKEMRGREFYAANQVNAEMITRFIMYWRGDINASWSIGYKNGLYDIVQIVEIGRNHGLEIMAKVQLGRK